MQASTSWLNTEGEYEPTALEKDTSREKNITAFVNKRAGAPVNTPIAKSIIEEISGVTDEIAAFVKAIETRTEPPISNTHALSVIKSLLAIEGSSRTGREVRLR